jgi:uncharacterized membrane protein
MMKKRTTLELTTHAFFIAIIALMGLVPFLGFIPLTPTVSITIIHIPVLIGAYLFRIKSATLFGLTFGVVSLLAVLTATAPAPADLLFVNPMISVFPRILFGFIAGVTFFLIRKVPSLLLNRIALLVAAFLLSIIHSFLVLTMIWVFETNTINELFGSLGGFVWAILLTNGFIEALLAAFIVPSVAIVVGRVPLLKKLYKGE